MNRKIVVSQAVDSETKLCSTQPCLLSKQKLNDNTTSNQPPGEHLLTTTKHNMNNNNNKNYNYNIGNNNNNKNKTKVKSVQCCAWDWEWGRGGRS